jgi:hypothetical protein
VIGGHRREVEGPECRCDPSSDEAAASSEHCRRQLVADELNTALEGDGDLGWPAGSCS